MTLLRAAFETKDDVIHMVVLCTGCFNEVIERAADSRHWCREITTGTCEFCEAEIRDAALNG